MTSEKVKYNTPLPGSEFSKRNLSIPAEAAKTLYEIDFQYGRDRGLCLSILTNVFRMYPQVTQVLQDADKGKSSDSEPWRRQAAVARTMRMTVLERKMAGISVRLAEMEKAHFAAQRDFERAEREEKGERAERGDRGVEEGEIATPSTPGASRPMFAPRSTDVRAQLYTIEDQKKRAEDEFEKLAEEQAFLKSDPRNEHFSEEEVKTAKAKAGGGAESKEGEGKVWKESLQKILVALLQTTTVALCRKKMAQLGRQAIKSCTREGRPLLDFVTDLDKALLFAGWQTEVFAEARGTVLTDALATLEQKAYEVFQEQLKQVEVAQFYYIIAEEPEPFQKVLARIRSGHVVTSTVPALPVKAQKGKSVKAPAPKSEDDEAEEEPPKKKKAAKQVAVAELDELEEGTEQSPLVAAIAGVLKDFTRKFFKELPTRSDKQREYATQGPQRAVAIYRQRPRATRFQGWQGKLQGW